MQQELIHDLAKKIDLANLKSNVDKLLKGSNRRGVWNSRGGWKIYQNLIVRGGGGGWKNMGGWKELKILIAKETGVSF